MKARRNLVTVLVAAIVLLVMLAGCERAEVNVIMNLSTETGAGDLTLEVFINWEDDSQDQLPNGAQGVVNSIQDYFDLKGIDVVFSPITEETVQFWGAEDIPGTGQQHLRDTQAMRFTFTFTFDSIDELNSRVALLSNGRQIATNYGFAELVPNPVDGTMTFVYRNLALEDLLDGVTEHIMYDDYNYSGDQNIGDMSRTRVFYANIDGVQQQRAIGPLAVFPNRTHEMHGSFVDASLIVAQPEPDPAPAEDPAPADEPAPADDPAPADEPAPANDPAPADDDNGNTVIIIAVAIIVAVAIVVLIAAVLAKKKK